MYVALLGIVSHISNKHEYLHENDFSFFFLNETFL